MTFAGLKKCMPSTSAGRPVACANTSTSSVDVLVAMIAPRLAMAPSLSHTCFFRSRFSNTASITRSQSASAA
jgi:hypothetical protein